MLYSCRKLPVHYIWATLRPQFVCGLNGSLQSYSLNASWSFQSSASTWYNLFTERLSRGDFAFLVCMWCRLFHAKHSVDHLAANTSPGSTWPELPAVKCPVHQTYDFFFVSLTPERMLPILLQKLRLTYFSLSLYVISLIVVQHRTDCVMAVLPPREYVIWSVLCATTCWLLHHYVFFTSKYAISLFSVQSPTKTIWWLFPYAKPVWHLISSYPSPYWLYRGLFSFQRVRDVICSLNIPADHLAVISAAQRVRDTVNLWKNQLLSILHPPPAVSMYVFQIIYNHSIC
jgi:hypothetical protein